MTAKLDKYAKSLYDRMFDSIPTEWQGFTWYESVALKLYSWKWHFWGWRNAKQWQDADGQWHPYGRWNWRCVFWFFTNTRERHIKQ